MPGLIGRKIGMTSVFSADGKNVPCTVIEAGPSRKTAMPPFSWALPRQRRRTPPSQ